MGIKIGIIGCGNMGMAFAEQLKSRYALFVYDKDRDKLSGLEGVNIAQGNTDLVNKADVVILAVKPQDFTMLLKEIKKVVAAKIIVSIAAGIDTAYIEKILGKVKVIRAMPNIGAKIGESVTCLCKGIFASNEDFDFARELFYYLGVVKEIDENMFNASTAISGSGPAYIFDFMESEKIDCNNISEQTKESITKRLAKAAEKIGFSHEDAMFLAVNTTYTSINLVKKTKMSPAQLREEVTSKGGTTEAALEAIHNGGTWEDAVVAALKRTQELSKKE